MSIHNIGFGWDLMDVEYYHSLRSQRHFLLLGASALDKIPVLTFSFDLEPTRKKEGRESPLDMEADSKAIRKTSNQLERKAQNRDDWRNA